MNEINLKSAVATRSRKPRIGLMGEFSAGKSTLSNLLLGARPLPEKVTATRLSPVWISHGTEAPYRVDVDGSHEPISLDRLEQVPVNETRVIRLFFESDILELCDLIDFPGISDPNMSSDVWERVLNEVDVVIWCTHATQAWRQSEAAVWDDIPEEIRERSILLITRFDKLNSDNDKARVMARVKRETDGLFGGTFPISLTQALASGDDQQKWEASGGAAFSDHLIALVEDLGGAVGTTDSMAYSAVGKQAGAAAEAVSSAAPQSPTITPLTLRTKVDDPEPAAPHVSPRRVTPQGNSRGARPRRPADPTSANKIVEMTHPDSSRGRPTPNSAKPGALRSVFDGPSALAESVEDESGTAHSTAAPDKTGLA